MVQNSPANDPPAAPAHRGCTQVPGRITQTCFSCTIKVLCDSHRARSLGQSRKACRLL